MTAAITLEDFGAARASQASDPAEEDAAMKAAYERGYRSGWDDATAANAAERAAISAELARNLRDLGFTYFEARDALLQSLSGFLAQITETLFPAILPAATRATLIAELEERAAAGLTGAVEITVTPEEETAVAALLPADAGLQITVRAEPDLSAGQAYIVFADEEIEVDLTPIIRRLMDIAAPSPAEGPRADER